MALALIRTFDSGNNIQDANLQLRLNIMAVVNVLAN
jgi:hypothetical protein